MDACDWALVEFVASQVSTKQKKGKQKLSHRPLALECGTLLGVIVCLASFLVAWSLFRWPSWFSVRSAQGRDTNCD